MTTKSMQPDIILYGAMWCGFCQKMKVYLDAEGLAYDWRNTDETANKESMVALTRGIEIIPTLVINGEPMVNPPVAAIQKKLANPDVIVSKFNKPKGQSFFGRLFGRTSPEDTTKGEDTDDR